MTSTDINVRTAHASRARDDSVKKGGNASGSCDSTSKRSNMESLAQGEHSEGKDATSQEKGATETRDGEDNNNKLLMYKGIRNN